MVRDLCAEYGLIHGVDPLTSSPNQENTLYWRLHGTGSYSYRYTDEDLIELKNLLRLQQAAEKAYILFNNITMTEDAERFRLLLANHDSSR